MLRAHRSMLATTYATPRAVGMHVTSFARSPRPVKAPHPAHINPASRRPPPHATRCPTRPATAPALAQVSCIKATPKLSRLSAKLSRLSGAVHSKSAQQRVPVE